MVREIGQRHWCSLPGQLIGEWTRSLTQIFLLFFIECCTLLLDVFWSLFSISMYKLCYSINKSINHSSASWKELYLWLKVQSLSNDKIKPHFYFKILFNAWVTLGFPHIQNFTDLSKTFNFAHRNPYPLPFPTAF